MSASNADKNSPGAKDRHGTHTFTSRMGNFLKKGMKSTKTISGSHAKRRGSKRRAKSPLTKKKNGKKQNKFIIKRKVSDEESKRMLKQSEMARKRMELTQKLNQNLINFGLSTKMSQTEKSNLYFDMEDYKIINTDRTINQSRKPEKGRKSKRKIPMSARMASGRKTGFQRTRIQTGNGLGRSRNPNNSFKASFSEKMLKTQEIAFLWQDKTTLKSARRLISSSTHKERARTAGRLSKTARAIKTFQTFSNAQNSKNQKSARLKTAIQAKRDTSLHNLDAELIQNLEADPEFKEGSKTSFFCSMSNVNKIFKKLQKNQKKKLKEQQVEALLEERFHKRKRLNFDDFKQSIVKVGHMTKEQLQRLETEVTEHGMEQQRSELIQKGLINPDSKISDFYTALGQFFGMVLDKDQTNVEISDLAPGTHSKAPDQQRFVLKKILLNRKENLKKKRYKNFAPFEELLRKDEVLSRKFIPSGRSVTPSDMKKLVKSQLKTNKGELRFFQEFMDKRDSKARLELESAYRRSKALQRSSYRNMTIKNIPNFADLEDNNLEEEDIEKVSAKVKKRALKDFLRLNPDIENPYHIHFLSKRSSRGIKGEKSVEIVKAWIKAKKTGAFQNQEDTGVEKRPWRGAGSAVRRKNHQKTENRQKTENMPILFKIEAKRPAEELMHERLKQARRSLTIHNFKSSLNLQNTDMGYGDEEALILEQNEPKGGNSRFHRSSTKIRGTRMIPGGALLEREVNVVPLSQFTGQDNQITLQDIAATNVMLAMYLIDKSKPCPHLVKPNAREGAVLAFVPNYFNRRDTLHLGPGHGGGRKRAITNPHKFLGTAFKTIYNRHSALVYFGGFGCRVFGSLHVFHFAKDSGEQRKPRDGQEHHGKGLEEPKSGKRRFSRVLKKGPKKVENEVVEVKEGSEEAKDDTGTWFEFGLRLVNEQNSLKKRGLNFYHHSAVLMKNKRWYLFGGFQVDDPNSVIMRRLNNEVYEIDVFNNVCRVPILRTMDRPSARRYHAACQLNQWMVIHGGLGYNDDVLIDMWLYYPKLMKWEEITLDCQGGAIRLLNGLACHKMVFCKNQRVYGELANSLIVFGGYDFEKHATNLLFQLKLQKGTAKAQIPRSKGSPPCARSLHAMEILPKLESIVVYGGMDQKGYYLEDMFVFLSITKTWIRVFSEDSRLKQRAGHSMACNGSEIFILGGYNGGGYCDSELCHLDVCVKEVFDIRKKPHTSKNHKKKR